jgi:uncharacterized membrane protein (DUF485 family)
MIGASAPGAAQGDAAQGMMQRWRRMTLGLAALLALIEGGFVMLVLYAKPLLARSVAGPLSLGLLLGILATIGGWAVACFYVVWANRAARAGAAS